MTKLDNVTMNELYSLKSKIDKDGICNSNVKSELDVALSDGGSVFNIIKTSAPNVNVRLK